MIADAWRSVWSPLDRRPVYEWAAEYVDLPAAYTKSGPFSIESSQQFVMPFLAFQSAFTHQINIMAPVRSGKSLISDVCIPWTIDVEPGPLLSVFHKNDIAKDHCVSRIKPVLETCPPVRHLLSDNRHDTTTQTILFKNKVPAFWRGQAIGNLQSKGIRYLFLDEVWEFKRGAIGQAKARCDDFLKLKNHKILIISQGSTDPEHDWVAEWNSGTLQEFQAPCAKCKKQMTLVFDGLRSDKSRYGLRFDHDKIQGKRVLNEKSVRYECQHCGHEHTNESVTKANWNKRGGYPLQKAYEKEVIKHKIPDGLPEVVSIHWNNVLDFPWKDLCKIFIKARDAQDIGNEDPMLQFITKRKAEHYDPEKTFSLFEVPRTEIQAVEQKFWEHQDFIFLTVDVQMGHFWCMVQAWCKDGRSAILQADIAYSWEEITELQERFKIPLVAVDIGYNKAESGYQCVMNNWIGMRGADAESFPFMVKGKVTHYPFSKTQLENPLAGMRDDDPRKVKLLELYKSNRNINYKWMYWSNPYFKNIAWNRKQRMDKGELVYVPDHIPDHFVLQMNSERRVRDTNQKTGMEKWIWKRIGNRPNHLWDCFCMSICLAHLPQFGISRFD